MAGEPRVLFVAPSAYPLGGVAVWLDYFVRGLIDRRWDVVVGLPSGHWHDVERYRLTYPDLPLVTFENPTGSTEGRVRALERLILRESPDLVVAVNIADTYAACRRLRRRRGVGFRVVMALHAIAADLLQDLSRERETVDAVVATNRLTCRLCTEVGDMPADRVFYAPYGVDVERLSKLLPRESGNSFRIAYVGRLEREQKRVAILPEVLAGLDQRGVRFELIIAGDGSQRPGLEQALRPWTDSGVVRFLGALPAGRVARQVYAQSDALLLTSAWETGPIVIWEAMAAGRAVVSSRYVGSGLEAALCHEENCLLYPVGDAAAAAAQISRLSDSALRERLAAAGREMVARRYSIEQSIGAWAYCLGQAARLPARPVCKILDPPRPAGRLDRLLGPKKGETVRSALGRSFRHVEPGGEWPHSLGIPERGEAALLRLAKQLEGP